jgi:hypothetical protein
MLLSICTSLHAFTEHDFKIDVNHPFGLVSVEDIVVASKILKDISAKIQRDGNKQISSCEDDDVSSLSNLSSRFYECMPTFSGMCAPAIIRDNEEVKLLYDILIEDLELSQNLRIDHYFQSRAFVCAIEREGAHSLPSSKPNPTDLSYDDDDYHRRLLSSLNCHIRRLEPGPELKMLHDMIVTPFPSQSLFAVIPHITHDHSDRQQPVKRTKRGIVGTTSDKCRSCVLYLPRRRGC